MKPTANAPKMAALYSAELLGEVEGPRGPRLRPVEVGPIPTPLELPALGPRVGGHRLQPVEPVPDPIPVPVPIPEPAPAPVLPGRTPEEGGPTVESVVAAYIRWAQMYYLKDGRPTSEPRSIETTCRPLRASYGATPARDFGPLKLKALRQGMIDAGYCRREINKRIGRIVRAFRWAAGEELVLPSVYQGLATVEGLREGRTPAREKAPIGPVADAPVDAIRPYVSRQVWEMVQLQRLTGMRPGEVLQMRTGDIDRTGEVWAYVPASHKTQHHGKRRVIYLGPRAQDVLRPWLRADPTAYLFQPCEAMGERRVAMRRLRKTKVQPSQCDRSKANPKRGPGRRYSAGSYSTAVARACDKAGVPHWHPNQLRHSAATRFRKEFGLDAARVILGRDGGLCGDRHHEGRGRDGAVGMMVIGCAGGDSR